MLSYQHIYHAGNMADVQKHLWLLTVLEYLGRKDKPYNWIDTHSGRGAYDLNAPEAQKLAEYKSGIVAVMNKLRSVDYPICQLYAQKMASVNGGKDVLKIYPGSSMLTASMLRGGDKLYSFELHPKEYEYLAKAMKLYKGAHAMKEDGYKGLKRLMPPPIRRGGVLIDPSYEVKEEYAQVVKDLRVALKKWPQGVFMVWYPILAAKRHADMCAGLTDIVQQAELEFTRDEWMFKGVERGMLGSGMFIINTPYRCADTMAAVKSILLPL